MGKKLAIIGGGTMACDLASVAREIGVQTVGFSLHEGALNKDIFDTFYDVDILDTENLLKLCQKEKIDGILPSTELTLVPANYIAEKMGLNGNPVSLMKNVTHKNWVRDRIKDAEYISQPLYQSFAGKEDYFTDAVTKFPVIVKPAGEGGKRGIRIVRDKSDLDEAVFQAFDADRNDAGILIEEFLEEGREFSVESLSFHGTHQIIQITDKISSGPPHCVELGHDQPADISQFLFDRISCAVIELLTKVNIENSACHTELKIVGKKIYLIELNARLGGDSIAHPMVKLSTGYDYLAETIRVSFDEEPLQRSEAKEKRYTGIRFVVKQTPYLQNLFDRCENESWLYQKHKVTDFCGELLHNDALHTNWFIYCADHRIKFPGEPSYKEKTEG